MRIEAKQTSKKSTTADTTIRSAATAGADNTGNPNATAIIAAFTRGLPKLFDKPAEKAALQKPSVSSVARPAADGSRAGGIITLRYTLANDAAAEEVIGALGPADEENLITDNMTLPKTVDNVDYAAKQNKAVFTIEWTEPAGAQHKRVMDAFDGKMSRAIRDTGKSQALDISAYGPTVDSTQQSSVRFTYEIASHGDFVQPDVAKKLAAALDVRKVAQLPAFVRDVRVTTKAHELMIDVSW